MKAKEIYKTIKKVCLKCKKDFNVFPYEKTIRKYCSRRCGAGNSLKGKNLTAEHKKKLFAGRDKFVYTPEIRKKMSDLKKGKPTWNKNLKGIYSEETRKKMASNKGRYGKDSHNWKGGISKTSEYYVIRQQKRKALKLKNGGIFTIDEWEDLKAKFKNMCLGCKKSEPEVKLTIDHIIPVSKGGRNEVSNIQPLCRSCNASKYTKIIKFEY